MYTIRLAIPRVERPVTQTGRNARSALSAGGNPISISKQTSGGNPISISKQTLSEPMPLSSPLLKHSAPTDLWVAATSDLTPGRQPGGIGPAVAAGTAGGRRAAVVACRAGGLGNTPTDKKSAVQTAQIALPGNHCGGDCGPVYTINDDCI